MYRAALLLVSTCLLLSFDFVPCDAFGESRYLQEGIQQYKEENYEEAVEALIKARKQAPKNSAAAFFLGLTYKQMEDYRKAIKHLRDAVILRPRIKQALVELIDVAAQLGELDEAKKWIEVAEEADISPAKMAFLKGHILSKEGKNMEAIKSFERAKSLNPKLAQAADFQIAMNYMKEKELKKAREMLKSVVLQDPESDLAGFARNYQDVVEKRIELERPYRITLAVSKQYNNNLLSNPRDTAWTSGSNDEHTYVFAPSLRVNFVPSLKSPLTFSAQYAVSASLNDKFSNSRDTVSNSLSVVPGYNFGAASLNLSTSYTHSMLRGPSYERYLDSLTVGPLLRTVFGKKNLVEFFVGYNIKEYADRNDPSASPSIDQEDKDSRGLSSYISWIWLFAEGAFFNLKTEYIDDTTDGAWWENDGYKFSSNVSLPLLEKLKLQLSGQLFIQEYRNNHTSLLNDWAKRDDETYTMSLGLTWDVYNNASMLAQHSKTILNSNIGLYEYEQDLYSVGVEYRY